MAEILRTGRICALILAGGQSRRMGQDKAALRLDGETLLSRAASFWKRTPGIDGVIVSVGAEDHFEALPDGVFAVPDLFPGFGPMAGLHAAFSLTDAEILYVSAVDMPFLRAEAILPPPKGGAIVYTRGGRPEPLFGADRRTILPALDKALRNGERKMRALLEQIETEYVPLPDALEKTVSNLNTRDDLMRTLAGTPPLILCMGWSGSGKTTFLEKLLPALCGRGLRAAVVKHDAHGFSMDAPGKDTYRLAQAGAVCTAISGPNGWAILSKDETGLEALVQKLPPVDLVIGEGFKYAPYPKIEVHRKATGKPFITHDAALLAAVTDEPLDVDVPQLGFDDADACAELILRTFFQDREATER